MKQGVFLLIWKLDQKQIWTIIIIYYYIYDALGPTGATKFYLQFYIGKNCLYR
jgi:hypothetical protein